MNKTVATFWLAVVAAASSLAQSIIPIEAWTIDLSKPTAKSIYITRITPVLVPAASQVVLELSASSGGTGVIRVCLDVADAE